MQVGIHVLVMLMFVGLGIAFYRGKALDLVAGYNTMTKAEKARVDQAGMGKFMGKLMFAIAGCNLVMALSPLLGNMLFLWLGMGLMMALVIGAVIYANTGDRFLRK
jgi:hypothetical protein